MYLHFPRQLCWCKVSRERHRRARNHARKGGIGGRRRASDHPRLGEHQNTTTPPRVSSSRASRPSPSSTLPSIPVKRVNTPRSDASLCIATRLSLLFEERRCVTPLSPPPTSHILDVSPTVSDTTKHKYVQCLYNLTHLPPVFPKNLKLCVCAVFVHHFFSLSVSLFCTDRAPTSTSTATEPLSVSPAVKPLYHVKSDPRKLCAERNVSVTPERPPGVSSPPSPVQFERRVKRRRLSTSVLPPPRSLPLAAKPTIAFDGLCKTHRTMREPSVSSGSRALLSISSLHPFPFSLSFSSSRPRTTALRLATIMR